MTSLRITFALAALLLPAAAHAQGCYDLSQGQPARLTGRLGYVIYAGPPNYEDVQRGDTPEPNFVLTLPRPICLTGDPDANPQSRFSRVQVIAERDLAPALRRLLGRQVTVSLRDGMAATTGHHHEPLVAWATAIAPATPAARPLDFVDEYGTPATTIRAFYAALHDSQGVAAAQMIAPARRGTPAFSPGALSRFYGGLATPIELVSIAQATPASYVVRYRYATRARACAGRAVVSTVTQGGRTFIAGIRALDGC